MGGIKTDTYGFTDIEGLFYAGEAGNNGVNGANRLGGNSLSEGAVFGKLTGYNAVKYSHRNKEFVDIKNEDIEKDKSLIEKLKNTKINAKEIKHQLGEIMYQKVGIIRNGYALKKALNKINDLKKLDINDEDSSLIEKLEAINGLDIAKAITMAALDREESRGAHFRMDFPESDHSFLHHTITKIN